MALLATSDPPDVDPELNIGLSNAVVAAGELAFSLTASVDDGGDGTVDDGFFEIVATPSAIETLSYRETVIRAFIKRSKRLVGRANPSHCFS